MGDDHAHAHSHGGGADASSDDHAHGHGHAHGDAGAHDPTPYVATSAKDGIVYYQAPDGRVLHSHDGLKPHSHDPIPHAGSFRARRPPLRRDYADRAFTVGVGGPVGTGKTALMLSLCRHLRDRYDIAAITNDIFTREDGEYLTKHGALDADRIRAVETGGCPHAAIREDVSANLTEAEALTRLHGGLDFILLESGGDNLAANFSRELADFIVYVIDVCGGDKIPRKGGPGVTQADLLVINKVELADAVGASLEVMARDAKKQRESGPLVMANVKRSVGVPEIAEHVIAAWTNATGGKKEKARDGADEGEKAREAKKAKA